jgi:hypothetical protein
MLINEQLQKHHIRSFNITTRVIIFGLILSWEDGKMELAF